MRLLSSVDGSVNYPQFVFFTSWKVVQEIPLCLCYCFVSSFMFSIECTC